MDEGLVKRIRGTTFSNKASYNHETAMIQAARGIFNRLLPGVYIFTDHRSGPPAGNSPGYGISLVAEATAGCFIFADAAVSCPRTEGAGEIDVEERKEWMSPEDVGEQIATVILGEIEQGGVVDSVHQDVLVISSCRCLYIILAVLVN